MFNPMKWWRNRRWVYLGYTVWTRSNSSAKKTGELTGHFYAWQPNMKKRKFVLATSRSDEDFLKNTTWYQETFIPWMEGGDMWKPIKHPVAVKGQLIDFYKGQQ